MELCKREKAYFLDFSAHASIVHWVLRSALPPGFLFNEFLIYSVIRNFSYCFPFLAPSSCLAERSLFSHVFYKFSVSLTCKLVGFPDKTAGKSYTATTWTSLFTALLFIGITPGMNDSIAEAQEKEAFVLHGVAVQANEFWTDLLCSKLELTDCSLN